MTWLLSPNVILAAIIMLAAGGLWDAHRRHVNERVEAKVGAVVAKINEKAEETVTKAAEGEASAPVIPDDKAALQALCDRSASCRGRKR